MFIPLMDEKSNVFLNCTKMVVEEVLNYYMRQISLIRPLSEKGKLKLTGEMANVIILNNY